MAAVADTAVVAMEAGAMVVVMVGTVIGAAEAIMAEAIGGVMADMVVASATLVLLIGEAPITIAGIHRRITTILVQHLHITTIIILQALTAIPFTIMTEARINFLFS